MQGDDLTIRQQRLKTWGCLEHDEISDARLRAIWSDSIREYRNLILKVWEEEATSQPELIAQLDNLERIISQHYEEIRYEARPKGVWR